MTARTNANPGVEIKVDGTGYPDEVKRSYRETFFTRHNLKPYKYVGCTMSLWQRLKRIVTNIGGERASVGMYVQNIVAYHLEDEDVKPLIAELSAASCLSDTDSKAMDGISLEAKKYQAKYLMGDMVNRKEREIYISGELGKRLKRIVLDIDGDRPTMGSYVEAILIEHLDACANLINEMTNDSKRKTV